MHSDTTRKTVLNSRLIRSNSSRMITITNLKKQFGENTAVDIDHFTINTGDILGLVGNNGAGKTTLFRIILDLLKADKGTISIDVPTKDNEESQHAINPAESEEWKSWTGAYIDESFLIDFLTPEEYFQFIGKVNDLTREETNARLEEFTHLMGGEILGQKKLLRNFSAGNKFPDHGRSEGDYHLVAALPEGRGL